MQMRMILLSFIVAFVVVLVFAVTRSWFQDHWHSCRALYFEDKENTIVSRVSFCIKFAWWTLKLLPEELRYQLEDRKNMTLQEVIAERVAAPVKKDRRARAWALTAVLGTLGLGFAFLFSLQARAQRELDQKLGIMALERSLAEQKRALMTFGKTAETQRVEIESLRQLNNDLKEQKQRVKHTLVEQKRALTSIETSAKSREEKIRKTIDQQRKRVEQMLDRVEILEQQQLRSNYFHWYEMAGVSLKQIRASDGMTKAQASQALWYWEKVAFSEYRYAADKDDGKAILWNERYRVLQVHALLNYPMLRKGWVLFKAGGVKAPKENEMMEYADIPDLTPAPTKALRRKYIEDVENAYAEIRTRDRKKRSSPKLLTKATVGPLHQWFKTRHLSSTTSAKVIDGSKRPASIDTERQSLISNELEEAMELMRQSASLIRINIPPLAGSDRKLLQNYGTYSQIKTSGLVDLLLVAPPEEQLALIQRVVDAMGVGGAREPPKRIQRFDGAAALAQRTGQGSLGLIDFVTLVQQGADPVPHLQQTGLVDNIISGFDDATCLMLLLNSRATSSPY